MWLPGTDMAGGYSLAWGAALVLASGCEGSLDRSGVSRHSCEALEKRPLEQQPPEETREEAGGGLDARQTKEAWQEGPQRALGGP